MPRDLPAYLTGNTLSGMSQLSKSDDDQKSKNEGPLPAGDDLVDDDLEEESDFIGELGQSNEKRDELHPYTQTLSLSDVESCVRLEEAAFPPAERCTREKFQYRLKHCSELSLGIFTSSENSDAPTAETSSPVVTGAPNRKAILMGHIVVTKTTNDTVTDNDMSMPTPENPDPNLGHKQEGRTLCIHSLAVLPQYQNKGLGKTLMKAYLQRMDNQNVADRAALIAHDHLIPYYEKFGFENLGKSKATFGGGGWYDMVYEFEYEEVMTD